MYIVCVTAKLKGKSFKLSDVLRAFVFIKKEGILNWNYVWQRFNIIITY